MAKPVKFLAGALQVLLVTLLALVLALLLTTGTTLARYSAGDTGTDSTRAAALAVEASAWNPDVTLPLTADSPQEYVFTVSNREKDCLSEIALEYDVRVRLYEPLPAGVHMQLDGRAPVEEGNLYTFPSVGVLPAGEEQSRQHTLQFTADATATEIDLEMEISVYAQQIDGGEA